MTWLPRGSLLHLKISTILDDSQNTVPIVQTVYGVSLIPSIAQSIYNSRDISQQIAWRNAAHTAYGINIADARGYSSRNGTSQMRCCFIKNCCTTQHRITRRQDISAQKQLQQPYYNTKINKNMSVHQKRKHESKYF